MMAALSMTVTLVADDRAKKLEAVEGKNLKLLDCMRDGLLLVSEASGKVRFASRPFEDLMLCESRPDRPEAAAAASVEDDEAIPRSLAVHPAGV